MFKIVSTCDLLSTDVPHNFIDLVFALPFNMLYSNYSCRPSLLELCGELKSADAPQPEVEDEVSDCRSNICLNETLQCQNCVIDKYSFTGSRKITC